MDIGVIQPLGPVNHAIIQVAVLFARHVQLVSEEELLVALLVQQVHTISVLIKLVFQLALQVIMPMDSLILITYVCNAIKTTFPATLMELVSLVLDLTQISA